MRVEVMRSHDTNKICVFVAVTDQEKQLMGNCGIGLAIGEALDAHDRRLEQARADERAARSRERAEAAVHGLSLVLYAGALSLAGEVGSLTDSAEYDEYDRIDRSL